MGHFPEINSTADGRIKRRKRRKQPKHIYIISSDRNKTADF